MKLAVLKAFLPLIVLQLSLMIIALIDLARREKVTWGNKIIWLAVIVLVGTFGPLIYFIFGRKES